MRQLLALMSRSLIAGCFLPCVALAGSEHPTVQIQPDGTILNDGTNCGMVGNDGYATFNVIAPQRLKNDYWDEKDYNPIRPTEAAHEEGFDYTHHGLMIDMASINKAGRTEFQSDYLEVPETRERLVYSPGNEGKMICLTVLHKPERSPYSRVESRFETLGYHAAAVATSWRIDKETGKSLINFKSGGIFSSLHAYLMLSVQLKAGRDIKQFYMSRGYSPTEATCLAAGTQTAAAPVMMTLMTPMNQLDIGGRYAGFWFSSLSRNTIDCIGNTVFQPLGEAVSPANGTIRQSGSLSVTDAWAGPGALATAYATQPLYSAFAPERYQNSPPVMWTKITITSTGGTRTFIKNINDRYFWRDSNILPYLHDGIIMISMAAEDNPSQVTTIYYDEYLKQVSSAYSGAALGTSERMQEMEQFFQGEVDNGINTVALTGMLQAATIGYPYVKAGAIKAAPYVSKVIPYSSTLGNAIGTAGSVIGTAKTGASKAISAAWNTVPSIPGSQYITALMPSSPAGATPAVSYTAVKGLGLHFSLNYLGPLSTLFTAKISDMMTDAATPRSMSRKLFQADMRLVIDHYVAGQ